MATVIGIAFVASAAFGSVGPASAATPGVVFLTAADIVTPGSFSTTGWNNLGPGTLTGTPLNGLTANANARPYFGFSSPLSTVGGTTLRDVGDSSFFTVSADVDITAEISWYADLAQTSEQYFFAIGGGADYFTDPTRLWRSSRSIGSIAAFTQATLSAFDAQLAADLTLAGASIQGVGFYNQGAPLIDVYSFTADSTQYYFTPEPTFTAPTSIGQVDFANAGAGVTVTTTGFVPGETVSTYLNTTQSTSDPIDLIADVDGAVTYTWVAPVNNMETGTYSVVFVGLSAGLMQSFDFDVTAQAALAATGFDAAPALAVSGVLLVGGVALAAIAARTRRRARPARQAADSASERR